jgi:peptidoglycan/xylan/chitin deacetylase (PgdA/CDA1 family)
MKRLLRRIAVRTLANPLSATALKPLWKGQVPIFMLHRAYDLEYAADGTKIEFLAQTLNALRQAGARFVSLRYLFECAAQNRRPEPGCVAFTIDDGYQDQGVLAREFLRQDCPVTIFLVSDFIDRKLWPWDEQLAYCVMKSRKSSVKVAGIPLALTLDSPATRQTAIDKLQKHCKTLPWEQVETLLSALWKDLDVSPPATPPNGHQPLSWDEVRQLESAGVDFGPHSVTHRVASQLTDSESRDEIATSWNRLQSELSRPLPIYAWPTGRTRDFSNRDVKIAQELGLLGAVATNDWYGKFGQKDLSRESLFRIDRFAIASQVDINLQYGTAIEQLKHMARHLFSRS